MGAFPAHETVLAGQVAIEGQIQFHGRQIESARENQGGVPWISAGVLPDKVTYLIDLLTIRPNTPLSERCEVRGCTILPYPYLQFGYPLPGLVLPGGSLRPLSAGIGRGISEEFEAGIGEEFQARPSECLKAMVPEEPFEAVMCKETFEAMLRKPLITRVRGWVRGWGGSRERMVTRPGKPLVTGMGVRMVARMGKPLITRVQAGSGDGSGSAASYENAW